MSELVSYHLAGGVATITMDDGKANAMSPGMLAEINQAFDQAETDEAVVILRGRPGMFSAGYDLKVFQAGDGDALLGMLRAGGNLVGRMLAFPRPIVAACTGHAMAQGMFTLMAADVRIGLDGSYKFGANEVSIGLAVPKYATEACRGKMNPAALDLALGTGRLVDPGTAQRWGVLDDLAADLDAFDERVAAEAEWLTSIVPLAHTEAKSRVRLDLATRMSTLVDDEFPLPAA